MGDGPGLVRRVGTRLRTISGLPTWLQEGKARRWCQYTIARLPQHSIGGARLHDIGGVANVTYVDQNDDFGPRLVGPGMPSRIWPCAHCSQHPSPFRERPACDDRSLAASWLDLSQAGLARRRCCRGHP